ncbi:MAG: rod shape-determining protein MreD [Treponema sp. GWB1_62_6]|nr:MAG: rod shape-determining protein MreD [Treponema sp. GWC1_61_84]OHE65176.1 MAG: rod shape-determining protein MreD [Treponema sp. GWB1_62_6]HCM26048.1 rod shape-determining protein MreD [Treponema sp.]
MFGSIAWATVIASVAALLQSTLLVKFAVFHAVPDLALGVLVYSAYINGTPVGQTVGFASGLVIDFMSAAPLGFNALLRTLIGAGAGLIKGTFFLDRFVLPVVLCIVATVLKAVVVALLHFLFAGAVPSYDLGTLVLPAEIALNAITAPFLFAFLNLFSRALRPRMDS